MSIDPLKSHNLGLSDAARTAQAAAAAGHADGSANSEADALAHRDSVELSSEARQLGEGAAVADPAGSSLASERLMEIASRIEAGFYDSTDVRDQVARRIAPDLGSN